MERWTPPTPEHTVVQSQSMLFAAALFIGCIIFDAQHGSLHFAASAQAPAQATAKAATRTAAASEPAMTAEDRLVFAEAERLYRAGSWSAAYGRFATLADHGEPRSARIALAMWRDGPGLYKKRWDASPAQLQAWTQAAGSGVPPVLISKD